MIKPSYIREAGPVEVSVLGGRLSARVECHSCGSHEEWHIATKTPPAEILRKHFSQKGWRMSKRSICPACTSKAQKPQIVKEVQMTNVAPIKPEPAPTEAVKAARRKANELLMFHFDVEAGRYDEGWSDERVAKESDMPVAWVLKRREDEYGTLKEPQEIDEIRGELYNLTERLAELRSKLDALVKKNGWAG